MAAYGPFAGAALDLVGIGVDALSENYTYT
jgi:hypothetical protein